MTDRAAYISGLRKLADLLEQNDVPLPWYGSSEYGPIYWFADDKDTVANLARILPGQKTKTVDDDSFYLVASIDGLHVKVRAERSEVCERVVVGVEEIEVEEREGEDTRPIVTRVETRELVEWECPPLLAEAGADA